jgi:hypothetical protein
MKKPKNKKKNAESGPAAAEAAKEEPKKPEIDWSAFKSDLLNEEPPKTDKKSKKEKKVNTCFCLVAFWEKYETIRILLHSALVHVNLAIYTFIFKSHYSSF